MNTYSRRHAALLGSLALTLNGALSQAPELKAIYQPTCSDSTYQAELDDCQAAVNQVWGLRGGIGTKSSGCVQVVQSGWCAVNLCDINNEQSTVDYIAIATAAQIQLAFCRNDKDTLTGGSTVIEGFEQPGQAHSNARVYLAFEEKKKTKTRASLSIKRHHVGDSSSGSAKIVARVQRVNAGITGYYVQEQWTWREDTSNSPWNYMILPQTQTRLVNGLDSDWRSRFSNWFGNLIRPRTNTAVEIQADGYRYNLALVAHDRQRISDIPLVDRVPIINAFFQLHQNVGNPRNLEAYLFDRNGNSIGMLSLMINPLPAVPNPANQILLGSGH